MLTTGTGIFILAVIVPPIFLYCSLLAYVQARARLGAGNHQLTDYFQRGIVLSYLFAGAWFVTGYLLARLGQAKLGEILSRAAHCMFTRTGNFSVLVQFPQQTSEVIEGYWLLSFLTFFIVSELARQRLLRGEPMGYVNVTRVWLLPAVTYWIIVGLCVYHALVRFIPLYELYRG
ncbi:MAG: hypothetical protein KatS3mg022_0173 [Armatimonadota bacterium]|nr:MAG: hypothetical protein KatS3mg022_0173 [Armatimonadota bacterium]